MSNTKTGLHPHFFSTLRTSQVEKAKCLAQHYKQNRQKKFKKNLIFLGLSERTYAPQDSPRNIKSIYSLEFSEERKFDYVPQFSE
jgi:hypothetical protein